MKPIDPVAAEKAADQHWDEMIEMLDPEQRRKALTAAMSAFDLSLAEQGVWVGDVFARAAHLELALEEWQAALEQQLTDTPTGPVH